MKLVAAQKRSNYLPSLDGWRAVAIFWVLEAHSQPASQGPFNNHWVHITGERGVQLFFALSGLLIGTRLLREEMNSGAISLKSFYTRRVFRIQPVALTYLAVVTVLMAAGAIARVWSADAGALLMVRNLFARHKVSWETAHFWSLSVEEHFYLFLPGFLVLCRRFRLLIMCALVVALEIWHVLVMHTPRLQGFTPLIYMRTDMVLGGILLGSVFALALTRQRFLHLAKAYLVPWVALSYTALVFTWLQFHHSNSDHALLITVYPVLITATMLHPESLTTRFLELPPLRFVGRISYGLYLWQQLFLNPNLVPAQGTFRSYTLLCWGAAFACAIATYYLVELPLIRRGHRIAARFEVKEQEKERELVAA